MTPLDAFARYKPTAERIASSYCRRVPPHVPREDIFAAALEGLWDAARKYHRATPERFHQAARIRVRGSVADFLRRNDWLPRHSRKRDGDRLRQVFIDSLEEPDHFYELSSPPNAETLLLESEARAALTTALLRLRKRERYIVTRFLAGLSRVEIAGEIGISQPRMSQIWSRIVGKLREVMTGGVARLPQRDWVAFQASYRSKP